MDPSSFCGGHVDMSIRSYLARIKDGIDVYKMIVVCLLGVLGSRIILVSTYFWLGGPRNPKSKIIALCKFLHFMLQCQLIDVEASYFVE